MFAAQLPALQVIIALLAAPVAFLLTRQLAWGFAAVISLVTLAVAASLLVAVAGGDVLSYRMGGWEPPLGIEYVVDPLSALILVIVATMGGVTIIGGRASVAAEIPAAKQPLYYSLMLLNLCGLLGMTITGDVFNLFVFLEISSLSTYALVAMGQGRAALLAAFRYLIIGTVGATFYVIGVGLLYMMTGTLNFADLSGRIDAVDDTSTVRTAMAFMLVGLGIKLGMMPLHFWLPGAYARAPSIVSAFLAATATKVGIYVFLRVIFTLYGQSLYGDTYTDEIVLVLGLFAMFAASATAIWQRDAKKLFAYSSLSQIGYMLLGIGLNTAAGLSAALIHVFNHALMKGALFMAIAAIVLRLGSSQIADFRGLGRAMPWTMAALVAAGFSLIGVPPSAGFISKWYLITASIGDGQIWLAVLILGSSLLAIIYVWTIVEAAYFKTRPDGAAPLSEAPPLLLGATWLLVLCNYAFGLYPDLIIDYAESAVDVLLRASAVGEMAE